MTKPFIGVSGNILRDNSGAYVDLLRSYVNHDYPRSIEEAGGIPVIINYHIYENTTPTSRYF